MFVIGPTGAGKSTLLSLLVLQWLRHPKAPRRHLRQGPQRPGGQLAGTAIYIARRAQPYDSVGETIAA
jgi:energy-coupling factor transporter ATP-binding protein EcfA2